MGQTEEGNDGQTIAEHLVENILIEVTRYINERTDSCFDSFESLKLQTFGIEDILDYGCSRRGKDKEFEDNVNGNCRDNDVCYPSLANLPEVCVHSSSLSTPSKQGEGDFQHPVIREAVAFYRLETGEEKINRPGGSKDFCGSSLFIDNLHNDAETVPLTPGTSKEENRTNGRKECKNSCSSSFTTETSLDELVEDLQRTINNVSFDSVHLDDSDDGSPSPQRSSGSNIAVDARSRELEDCVCLFDDQGVVEYDIDGSYDCPEKQTCLHQSKKFYQFHKGNFFPHDEIPSDYCQLVNESYDKYDSVARDEDEQILLSEGSSEELVIIESDEIDEIPREKNLCSVRPSTTVLSQFPSCAPPGTSYGNSVEDRSSGEQPLENANSITVVADVEPSKDHRNWEEALEVQMNVTEPTKQTELDGDEESDFDKSRKYWTSVGLVTEKNVDPKNAMFSGDDVNGIESVPGVLRVKETRLKRNRQEEDEILTFNEFIERDANLKFNQNLGLHNQIEFEENAKEDIEIIYNQNYRVELEKSGKNLSDDCNVNYLNFSEEAAKTEKKKNKFVSRLTKSVTNLFRFRKKNPK